MSCIFNEYSINFLNDVISAEEIYLKEMVQRHVLEVSRISLLHGRVSFMVVMLRLLIKATQENIHLFGPIIYFNRRYLKT